jgi:hypothetical protein
MQESQLSVTPSESASNLDSVLSTPVSSCHSSTTPDHSSAMDMDTSFSLSRIQNAKERTRSEDILRLAFSKPNAFMSRAGVWVDLFAMGLGSRGDNAGSEI